MSKWIPQREFREIYIGSEKEKQLEKTEDLV